ncbi:MAG: hypothetical protein DCC71_16235, partial [Proteobacteria bacterium]
MSDARGERRAALAIAAALFGVALAAYAPARAFDFVAWDDSSAIASNPAVTQGLSLASLRLAFEPYYGNWIPLTWISLAVDHALFGLDAGGYHMTNALWHAATAALLFAVLARAVGAAPAAFVGLSFALHPLRVESVAWVTERKDVLSGFFFVATVGAWLAYGRRPSAPRYLAALALLAASLASKATGVTLPFVLLLLDFWPLGRLASGAAIARAVAEKLPMLALAAAVAATTFAAQQDTGAVATLSRVPAPVRLGHALVSYVWYLEKAFWPAGLAVFHPHPHAMPPARALAGAAGLLASISAVALAAARRRPWLLVGWLWFLGTLVPMIGLVQVGMQAHADRYAYLPMIGLELALACEAWRWLGSLRAGRAVFAAAAAAAAIALFAATRAQLAHWRDTEALFAHALAVTRDNFVAHEKLGRARLAAGDADAALHHLGEAVRIEPRWPAARAGLAEALWHKGQRDAAIWNWREAVKIDPRDGAIRQRLAFALLEMGWADDAVRELVAARSSGLVQPTAAFESLLATALARRGDRDGALAHADAALRLEPGHAGAHALVGRLRVAEDPAAAERALRA